MDYKNFTDNAKIVMARANGWAQHLNHEYISDEHILLGLAGLQMGTAQEVLKYLKIQPQTIISEVEKLLQSGPEMLAMGKLPMTPNARKALEFAQEEANNLGHNYVGTAHLLLGLMRNIATHSIASSVLRGLQCTLRTLPIGISSRALTLEIVRGAVMLVLEQEKDKAAGSSGLIFCDTLCFQFPQSPNDLCARLEALLRSALNIPSSMKIDTVVVKVK